MCIFYGFFFKTLLIAIMTIKRAVVFCLFLFLRLFVFVCFCYLFFFSRNHSKCEVFIVNVAFWNRNCWFWPLFFKMKTTMI